MFSRQAKAADQAHALRALAHTAAAHAEASIQQPTKVDLVIVGPHQRGACDDYLGAADPRLQLPASRSRIPNFQSIKSKAQALATKVDTLMPDCDLTARPEPGRQALGRVKRLHVGVSETLDRCFGHAGRKSCVFRLPANPEERESVTNLLEHRHDVRDWHTSEDGATLFVRGF